MAAPARRSVPVNGARAATIRQSPMPALTNASCPAPNSPGYAHTWIDGELWHGTWEGDESELRRLNPRTGEVQEGGSRCRLGWACLGSSPTAATGSSAGAGAAV